MASTIELPKLSTPAGGSALRGMGESYTADDFTGAATFRIPIPASPCREVTPQLAVSYASGSGNGPFGLGFDLALARISRRTDTGIPRYDDADEFMADGEVLVPALEQVGAEWRPRVSERSDGGAEYRVTRYRKRVDGDGTRYERWRRLSDNDEHWRLASADGSVAILGFEPAARIADPAAPQRVHAWLIERATTALGDRVEYRYKAEDDDNVPSLPSNAGRDHRANRYIAEIRYGAYDDGNGGVAYAMSLVFDYGEYDIGADNPDPYTPVRTWPARPDPFSNYRSGFEIRTYRLCRGVLMFHALPELGELPCLVSATVLEHALQDGLSVLTRAEHRGYRRAGDGTYEMLELPGVRLDYQRFEPARQSFQAVTPERGAFPAPLSQGELVVADLLGEGLPGLLFSTSTVCAFWRNLGEGRFAPALTPQAMPVQRDFSAGRQLLTSLQGNGQLDCVVAEDGQAGYYRYDRGSGWSAFRAFPQWAPESATPAAQFVDLNGNGLSDLLVMQGERLRWYPGEGEDGYGDPVELVLPQGVPDPREASAREYIDFADLFGDGGAHLVRIRDDSVECWPSLGYGRFGGRVLFDGAPGFPGSFDARRLRLADVSGSGGADLLYFGERQVLLYMNLGGNGFAAPVAVELPAPYSQLSYAGSADLLGNGGHNLLLGTATQGQWLIDFTGGRKPWLLSTVLNDLGASTRLSYGSSSRFALQDALAGRPWPCALPFPVQVVTSVASTEPFSGAEQTLRLAYHDGYYDPVARSFRGFGYVERWSEQTVDGQSYAPAAYTRSWYDTGAFVGGDALTLQYQRDYWHGVAGRQPPPPDSAIETLAATPDAALLRVAHRALKGQPLRSESYGLDGGDREAVPFAVVSHSYTVSELQPGSGDADAVFRVSARETVDAVYERDADDPRIGQQFTLKVDDYGHVLLSVAIASGRGSGSVDGSLSPAPWPAFQTQVLVTASQAGYGAPLEHDGAFIVPALEEISYQLGQVQPPAGGWLDFAAVATLTGEALQDVIPPQQAFSGTQPQARLRLATRSLYWDATQTQPLPFRSAAWPALLHHSTATRFSAGMVTDIYGDRLDAQQLREQGLLQLEDDYWWAPGDITQYTGAAQFHRPMSSTDAAGNTVSVGYDAYALLPISITNADGTATAVPDYRTLQTATLVDVNGVVDQIRSDALGRVIVATRYHAPAGGQRQGDGDIGGYVPKAAVDMDAVLAAPADYLQQMTAYFFYDFRTGSGQPPVVLSVARQLHVSQLPSGTSSPLKLVASYDDSLGRVIEVKTAAEAAACGRDQDAWVSSKRVQLDLQGQAVKRWLDAFTDSVAFTGYDAGWYDTDWRDARGRVIETLTAKGFIARNAYRPWTSDQWDLDDTVTTSPYYLAHIGNTSPEFADERSALEQAAFFADTYLTQWLDPLGRVVELEQRNRSTDAPDVRSMVTSSLLDIDGRTLALADPRFSARNAAGGTPIYNIASRYDLGGNAVSLDSIDSGSRLIFSDAMGRLVHQWDGRGVHSRRDYDAMSRLTQVYVDGALGLQQVVERLSYGTDAASNSIGRRVELRDSAGLHKDGPFDLGGQPLRSSFELRVDYATEVDWSPGSTVALESARITESRRNAFEQLYDKTCADGSRERTTYYAIGWVAAIDLALAGAAAKPVLANAVYNADGKRASARLGGDVLAVRGYEDSTGRLLSIDSSRASDGKALQRIGYTYDPMGNVTCAEDATVPLVFCNQSQIGPRQAYGYDAIYRLRAASGRENPAITADSYRTGFKQSAYLPLCPDNPSDGAKLVSYDESYWYDDSGNLTRLQHSTPLSTLSWTRDYTVSETSNRAVLDGDGGQRDPDDAYDVNGNMVDFEHLRSMEWDWRNRPRRAVTIARNGDDDDAQFYVYDSAGRRVRRVTQRLTAGGLQVEDKVYLDGCELVRTLPASGTPEVERTGVSVGDGGGRLLMAYYWPDSDGRAPQWRFQLSTVTGSAALEVEADGSLISYEEYFPYGGTAIIAGNAQVEVELKFYRFCGKECDDATGLYYFGDRYYATWLARWLSPDPNGPVDSPNLYQYVGCNPLSYVDPSGGCKAMVTGSSGGLDFSSFEASYQYLSDDDVQAYDKLAQDLHDYIWTKNSKALDSVTERFSSDLEQRVLAMFDKFKTLHIASNPSLLQVFRTAQKNAGVNDNTGGIDNYTKMRSPHFTNAMNATEMGTIVARPQFHKTVELHHGAKKQFLPELATSSKNLWAFTRGGTSYGDYGIHDRAFHVVGAAKTGNMYQNEVGAYTGLMLHWEGIQKLPGDDPLTKAPAYTPTSVFATVPQTPLLPSFSELMASIPQLSYQQPQMQQVVMTYPLGGYQPVYQLSPQPMMAPPNFGWSGTYGGSHPPVFNGWYQQ